MALKKDFFIGIFYTALSKYSTVVITLIVTIILSRILTPRDFGIVAISTVLINFFNIISEMGIGPAIIQNRNLNLKDIESIFSLTVWISFIISISFFFLSRIVSNFYDNLQLDVICKLLSVNIFFNTLNIVPNSLILKDKKFKFISKRNILIQIIFGSLSVICAVYGLGIYSLLILPIFTSIFMFLINYWYYPISWNFFFDIKSIKKIYLFSVYQFLFSFINFFSRNLDKLIIGKYINITQLGYYEKSYRLMMIPIQNITSVITPVMQPLLSDYQHDKTVLYRYVNKISSILSYVGVILTVFLFFSAKDLIYMLFGDQWAYAVPAFKILSLSVWIQMVTSSHGSFLQSGNAANFLFFSGLVNSLLNIIGLLIAILLFNSIEYIAVFINITFTLNLIVNYYFIYSKMLNKNMFKELIYLIKPIILGIILFFILSILNVDYLHFAIRLLIYFIVVSLASCLFLIFIKEISFKKINNLKNELFN